MRRSSDSHGHLRTMWVMESHSLTKKMGAACYSEPNAKILPFALNHGYTVYYN